ncbi:MAG TPA: biotin--[acetyl-CoA-carboxylase] ligase, partial [Cyclobacteriaceae bacterium]|nr:biotin--[acetyl-CoA-carboxylase] ligase [Cyclobacteriaceae bacterium]
AEGTVVITDNQTAGRGQRGNTWESEPGLNLTFSVILKPVFLHPKDQFMLNMAVSLGLYDYLTVQTAGVKIKWPNDMMLGNKKTCGILIENQVNGRQIQSSVAGIGLNVNQKRFSLSTPTSLTLATGRAFVLNDVLTELLQWMEARYLQLRAGIDLRMEYIAALYGRGEKRKFKTGDEIFEGVISGVDAVGLLEVEVNSGKRYFELKQVQFLS